MREREVGKGGRERRFENGAADYTVASGNVSYPTMAALLFERNLVIPKRRLPRQTSSGLFNVPIWNTFRDPDQLPTARIPHDGMRWDGGARRRF